MVDAAGRDESRSPARLTVHYMDMDVPYVAVAGRDAARRRVSRVAWRARRRGRDETWDGRSARDDLESPSGPRSDGLERPVESCSAVGLAPRASPARPHGTLRHALRATARAQAPRDGHCTHTGPEPDTAADTGVGYPLAPGQAGRAPAPPRRAPAPYPRTLDPRPRSRESVARAGPGTRALGRGSRARGAVAVSGRPDCLPHTHSWSRPKVCTWSTRRK